MKKNAWKEKIRSACVAAGTYKECFDEVISTLAEILERRDEAAKEYRKNKRENNEGLIVEQTNKAGHTNYVKNPLVAIWDEMNKQALSYWRDLGLTPAGLKKIKEESFAKAGKQSNSLLSLLNQKKEAEKK